MTEAMNSETTLRARLGDGEFFVNGDTFDLVFRPGGGSYCGADQVVARMACGPTAYYLPGIVATLLNEALNNRITPAATLTEEDRWRVARALSIPQHHTTWGVIPEREKDLFYMQAGYAIDAILTALRTDAAVEENERRDAARWRALLSGGRVRMQGSANVDPEKGGRRSDKEWVHFGAEFWSFYPGYEENGAYDADREAAIRQWFQHAVTALADDIIARAALSDKAPSDD